MSKKISGSNASKGVPDKLTLKKIRLALMDVDGVLTNGVVYHFALKEGLVEFKGVHAQDAISLAWLADCQIKTGIISGRNSAGLAERLKALKVSFIYQGRLDKKVVFDEICRDSGISPNETLYIGDDLPDIPVIKSAGIGVAVQNARPEVKQAAHWVTENSGGKGAVREVAEAVLKAQGLWPKILETFR